MKKVDCKPAARQRGAVSVMLILILVTAVVFVLVQTFVVSGSSSSDQSRQGDRVGSLTLAESGIELATVKLEKGIGDVGSFDSSTNCCLNSTGAACGAYGLPSGALTLGGDSKFQFVSVATDPPGCPNGCPACVVTVRGETSSTTRTIRSIFRMSSMSFCKHDNDKDCSNQTASTTTLPIWWLPLPGQPAAPLGIGVFNLAAAGSVGCWTGGDCLAAGDLRWHLSANSKILGLGNTVQQSAAETNVYQRLSASTDIALTGALFPGHGSNAGIVGAYWDMDATKAPGLTTKGAGTTLTGHTNNGAAFQPSVPTACVSPSATSANWPTAQTCSNWCYVDGATPEGDTLVFGFSAHSTGSAKTSQLEPGVVAFNTIPLTRLSKAPTVANTPAADSVYSELWYKQNAAYSYGTRILGTITGGTSFEGSFDVTFVQNKGVCVKTYNDFAASVKEGDVLNANDNDTKNAFGSSTITVDTVYNPGVSGNECANQYPEFV